jgi:hypothetical protein
MPLGIGISGYSISLFSRTAGSSACYFSNWKETNNMIIRPLKVHLTNMFAITYSVETWSGSSSLPGASMALTQLLP